MEVKGVSAVVYDNNGKLFYLLLKRDSNWQGYEFPKAKIRGDEDEKAALLRALKEKAGVTMAKFDSKFGRAREFESNGKKHYYDVYVIEGNMNTPVNHSKKKHSSYIWTDAAGVRERLTFESDKALLEEVNEMLMKR